MKYAKGVCWVDDTRIPFIDGGENTSRKQTPVSVEVYGWANHKGQIGSFDDSAKQGRFTPSLLVCDDMLNDGRITKTTASKGHIRKGNVLGDTRTSVAAGQFGDGAWIEGTNINDKGTNSRFYDLDKWFDKVINNL
jgi:hypothetical protein